MIQSSVEVFQTIVKNLTMGLKLNDQEYKKTEDWKKNIENVLKWS